MTSADTAINEPGRTQPDAPLPDDPERADGGGARAAAETAPASQSGPPAASGARPTGRGDQPGPQVDAGARPNTPAAAPKGARKGGSDPRAERLAAALRANLGKRKAAARRAPAALPADSDAAEETN